MTSRVSRVVAAAAAAAVLLAGCTTDARPGAPTAVPETRVDVDTPEQREVKRRAGIADCRPGEGEPRTDGAALPDLTLPCLGGGPDVRLSTLRGPLVINLWAYWCGPCREELPYYQQLHERAGDRLQVLGIDYEDTRPLAALELLEETGVTYPSLADPAGALHEPFRVRALPGLALVDEDGRLVHLEYVVIRRYQDLADLVGEHLGVDV